MAEVLGPIGLCFGCISFILSTVPTAAKGLNDFLECVELFREYETRLVRCKAKADKWEMHWRHMSGFGEHEAVVDKTKGGIEELCQAIENGIETNMKDDKEQKTWRNIRDGLRCGRFRKPKPKEKTVNFFRSVGFILYQKNVIEGWIARLETAIECIDHLSEIEFEKRTAGHFSTCPSRAQVLETKELEDFLQGLTSLAQRLHDESTATATGPEPTTYGWAIGLRPPLIDVEHWKFIAKVPIELRFSISQSADDNKHFHLHVPFHKDDQKTHLSSEQIKQLVCGQNASKGCINAAATTAKRSTQKFQARRTRPIGDLLKEAPTLFLNRAWRTDRAILVQGISHWALLLWDTAWMENLCCYGLQIEKGVAEKECIMQIFNIGECPKHAGCHHNSRLRNLGLVLAQLILETPIRLASNGDSKEYEQWTNGNWEVLYRSDIIAEVFTKTTSTPLCDAISFCFKDESVLANERFQPGFLFKCIHHIYIPLNKWYQTESQGTKIRAEKEAKTLDVSERYGWPEEAMCKVRETQQPEHPQPERPKSLPEQLRVADRLSWIVFAIWPITARYLVGIIFSTVAVVSLLPHDIPFTWKWSDQEREWWPLAGHNT